MSWIISRFKFSFTVLDNIMLSDILQRKTINGEDILFAMSTLGFDNYVEPLKLYLQKYREAMKGDKGQGAEGTFEDNMVHDVSDGTTLLATSTLQQIRTDQSGGQVLLTYGGNQSFQLS